MKKLVNTVLVCVLCTPLLAQTVDTTAKLTVNGYVEAYYSYDFNQPTTNERPSFLYSHNRHNEFNVNLCSSVLLVLSRYTTTSSPLFGVSSSLSVRFSLVEQC